MGRGRAASKISPARVKARIRRNCLMYFINASQMLDGVIVSQFVKMCKWRTLYK
jgi:hypothetical protein